LNTFAVIFNLNKKIMKKLALLALVAVAFTSCKKDGFTINGDAKGVKDGISVVLKKQDSTGITPIDTVKVKDGKFKFEGTFKEQGIHFLEIDQLVGQVILIVENGTIDVSVNKDTINKSKISGTTSNDRLSSYLVESDKIAKRMSDFQATNNEAYRMANEKKDTVAINTLMKQMQGFQDDFKKISETEISKNPESFLSLLLMQQFANMPGADMAKNKKMFASLSENLRNSKMGKKIDAILNPKPATAEKKK
jgi:flagellin-specific chaperone FliS